MSAREKLSVSLIVVGLILAFMPLSGKYTLKEKPRDLLNEILVDDISLMVDQVALSIVREDSTLQLIDLRPSEEFIKLHLPGAINIPYSELLERDLHSLLGRENVRNVFYSNGDIYPGYAVVLARGLGYRNNYIMTGGLNDWFATIMNSQFSGTRISARENALYETRAKAGRLFTEYNLLPDSLKLKFAEARQVEAKKLDGGCE